MQKFYTDISGKSQTDAESPVLDLLHNINCGLRTMKERDGTILKHRPDVYLVESY